MAGIGFELKKLFTKSGVINQVKAYAYSSLATIGPMIFSIIMLFAIQIMMQQFHFTYVDRQLFLGGVIYCFIFSYLVASTCITFLTRNLADLLYTKQYDDALPLLLKTMKLIVPSGAVFALAFLFVAKLELLLTFSYYILFMQFVLIWLLSVYITTTKQYKKIVFAYFSGIALSLLSIYVYLNIVSGVQLHTVILLLDGGYLLTLGLLWRHITALFSSNQTFKRASPSESIKKYPSLVLFGIVSSFGLFSHQLVQWFGPNGSWIGGVFLMSLRYDVAVFYAFITIIPSLILFVIHMETAFYEKYKVYYQLVVGQGAIREIDDARYEIVTTLYKELSLIAGIQLIVSLLSVALGNRLLPLIGFISSQVDTFNILVMGFYLFMIYNMISVLLLYFDDRKGTVLLALLFLFLSTLLSVFMIRLEVQGFAFFFAALVTVMASFFRLAHILTNLHYYTFCSQPLSAITRGKK